MATVEKQVKRRRRRAVITDVVIFFTVLSQVRKCRSSLQALYEVNRKNAIFGVIFYKISRNFLLPSKIHVLSSQEDTRVS